MKKQTEISLMDTNNVKYLQVEEYLKHPFLYINLSKFVNLEQFHYVSYGLFFRTNFFRRNLQKYNYAVLKDLKKLKILTISIFSEDLPNIKNYLEQNECWDLTIYLPANNFVGEYYLSDIIQYQKKIERVILPLAISSLPDSLASLQELWYLRLHSPNAIALSPEMQKMQKLSYLNLCIDFSKNENWEILSNIQNLEHLILQDMDKGEEPILLPSNFKKLKTINLVSTKLLLLPENTGLYMDSLKSIDAPIDLRDSISLEQISSMPALEDLDIRIPLAFSDFPIVLEKLQHIGNVRLYCRSKADYNRVQSELLPLYPSDKFTIMLWNKKAYSGDYSKVIKKKKRPVIHD
jgi:hypothetical protein